MFSRHNTHLLNKAKASYKEQVKKIHYWDKVEKAFAGSNQHRFSRSFGHPEYDDESKIEYLAMKYGYKIVDEHLYHDKSVYVFEKETSLA